MRRDRAPVDSKQWLARAHAGEAAEVGLLLDCLVTARSTETLQRLQVFADVDDPRLGTFVARVLEHPPFSCGASARPFWRALFTLATRLADPRLLSRKPPGEQLCPDHGLEF